MGRTTGNAGEEDRSDRGGNTDPAAHNGGKTRRGKSKNPWSLEQAIEGEPVIHEEAKGRDRPGQEIESYESGTQR